MTETKTVCDRCGKEINGFSRIKIWKDVYKRQVLLKLHHCFSQCFFYLPGCHTLIRGECGRTHDLFSFTVRSAIYPDSVAVPSFLYICHIVPP